MPSRLPSVLVAASVLTAVALLPLPGASQSAAPSPTLPGRYAYAGNAAQGEAIIRQAVEPAIAHMDPETQRLARNRIAETTWLPQTIEVTAQPSRIRVRFDGVETRLFDTAPGQPTTIFTRSGVRAQLVQVFRPDGGIQQQMRATDGTQIHILTGDGSQLFLDVIMQSRRFRSEVRFRLSYRRVG